MSSAAWGRTSFPPRSKIRTKTRDRHGPGFFDRILDGRKQLCYADGEAHSVKKERISMTFQEIINYAKSCVMEKYAKFDGRARRAEYWSFALCSGVISSV